MNQSKRLSSACVLLALFGVSACSETAETIEILDSGTGRLISSEAIAGTDDFNCRYRREDGTEWVRRQTGECASTDTSFRLSGRAVNASIS